MHKLVSSLCIRSIKKKTLSLYELRAQKKIKQFPLDVLDPHLHANFTHGLFNLRTRQAYARSARGSPVTSLHVAKLERDM